MRSTASIPVYFALFLVLTVAIPACAGMSLKTFKSDSSGYSIQYPGNWSRPPEWLTDEKAGARATMMTVGNNSSRHPLSLSVFYVKQPNALKDEVEALDTIMLGMNQDLEIISSEPRLPAWDWYTSYSYALVGVPYFEEDYYKLSPSGSLYRISLSCSKDMYNTALFKTIISSFTLLPAQPAKSN
ncbi:MAG: hypothetical protein PHG36_11595 [Dehalococcoidia bacterium]|nr:hypothetical protein [Dehalococcoidia bacterium]